MSLQQLGCFNDVPKTDADAMFVCGWPFQQIAHTYTAVYYGDARELRL